MLRRTAVRGPRKARATQLSPRSSRPAGSTGCAPAGRRRRHRPHTSSRRRAAAAGAAAVAARPRIVVLGDSLTAGLGLSPRGGVSDAAAAEARRRRASITRSSTPACRATRRRAACRRLDWALDGDVRVLIVALGGNDALRALPADELKQNLSTHHRARAGQAHPGRAGRHGSAAELRPRLHRHIPSGVPRARPGSIMSPSCRSCSQGVAAIPR